MEWIFLLIAGILEIVWAYTLDLSQGFSILIPTLITIVLVLVCFYCLEKAVAKLGIGISYACFTAMGTVGTYVLGVVRQVQTINLGSIISLCILIFGIIGLKVTSSKKDVK